MKPWNSLICDVVTAPTLNDFKSRLDKCWKNHPKKIQSTGVTTREEGWNTGSNLDYPIGSLRPVGYPTSNIFTMICLKNCIFVNSLWIIGRFRPVIQEQNSICKKKKSRNRGPRQLCGQSPLSYCCNHKTNMIN